MSRYKVSARNWTEELAARFGFAEKLLSNGLPYKVAPELDPVVDLSDAEVIDLIMVHGRASIVADVEGDLRTLEFENYYD